MDASRRRLLSALALSAPFGGCLARAPRADRGTETTESTVGTPTTTEPTRTETTMNDPYETKRAIGEPTSVEKTVEDENLEYIEETDEVRYVAGWRAPSDEAIENGSKPEREPVYDTVPFERWARVECLSIGAKAVYGALGERLDGGTKGLSVGFGRVEGQSESRIHVSVETLLDREGDVISEPSVEFEEIVAATPRTVEVTFSFAGKERSCTEPAFVNERTIQEQ